MLIFVASDGITLITSNNLTSYRPTASVTQLTSDPNKPSEGMLSSFLYVMSFYSLTGLLNTVTTTMCILQSKIEHLLEVPILMVRLKSNRHTCQSTESVTYRFGISKKSDMLFTIFSEKCIYHAK